MRRGSGGGNVTGPTVPSQLLNARKPAAVETLVENFGDLFLPIALDVTDRDAVFAAVEKAAERFGRLDVVVKNADYGHFGMVEELSEAELRAQLETNLFGTVWVTQAVLPIMRKQGSGHILQVTSEGGVMAFPGIGAYHASKWAVEGLSQSLAQEIAGFGIHVTMVEPGPYATNWLDTGSTDSIESPDYDAVRTAISRGWDADAVGDPFATRAAILAVVDARKPPLRVFFGKNQLAEVSADYQTRLATWHEWQPISVAAFGH